MTFFTEDTCYNLALVTVLALVALYLIGKFYAKENFTEYWEFADPKNYAECVAQKGNISGVNTIVKSKYCDDTNNPIQNIIPLIYYDYSDPIDYAKCMAQQDNKRGVDNENYKFCNDSITPVTNPIANQIYNMTYLQSIDPFLYNNCVLQGGFVPPSKKTCSIRSGFYRSPQTQEPVQTLAPIPAQQPSHKIPLKGCLENGGRIMPLPNGNLKCIKKTT